MYHAMYRLCSKETVGQSRLCCDCKMHVICTNDVRIVYLSHSRQTWADCEVKVGYLRDKRLTHSPIISAIERSEMSPA